MNLGADLENITEATQNFKKAQGLVTYAVNNNIIPKEYIKPACDNCTPRDSNAQLKSDLINYIMDGTIPKDGTEDYKKMIQEKGRLLFDNQYNVEKK